ncbi:MAG TPA: HNH endonuclease signature motif containing protein [Actinomycetota bacterium]|nr:HNH endonuclease signature motif containing protein [Actinomycetota bacterium]
MDRDHADEGGEAVEEPDPLVQAIALVERANELVEKANADLEPELLQRQRARRLLESYSRTRRLADFGIASLARKLDDAAEVSRTTGTSLGGARAVVETGKTMAGAHDLGAALQGGVISLEQAGEIARAEESAPGVAAELVAVARERPFHVLRERARKARLEAEQHRDLGARQRAARSARSWGDDLGMVHIHLALEPHVGTPLVARAEAEAERIAKRARTGSTDKDKEPFERYLADAYASLVAGNGRGRARRPELVVLVSHEVAARGWSDVREEEVCKVPGVGPVPPRVAREIAENAFLSGVFYDGVDLRHFARWSRGIPVEVAVALELGDPPEFDGVACATCGRRFRTEFDHHEPHAAGGPVSTTNIDPLCWTCHRDKTARDRRAGRLGPPPGGRGKEAGTPKRGDGEPPEP